MVIGKRCHCTKMCKGWIQAGGGRTLGDEESAHASAHISSLWREREARRSFPGKPLPWEELDLLHNLYPEYRKGMLETRAGARSSAYRGSVSSACHMCEGVSRRARCCVQGHRAQTRECLSATFLKHVIEQMYKCCQCNFFVDSVLIRLMITDIQLCTPPLQTRTKSLNISNYKTLSNATIQITHTFLLKCLKN